MNIFSDKGKGGAMCPIDNRAECTLPMAAARLGLSPAEAAALLARHGAPFQCVHYRKDRADWTKYETEDFDYAERVMGLTESDYPAEGVLYYSGKAVRELGRLLELDTSI